MKRLITAGVCLASYSCLGHAQSAVSLFGIVDVGFVYNNNARGAKQYSMVAGSLKGNRWGCSAKRIWVVATKQCSCLKAAFRRQTALSYQAAPSLAGRLMSD